MPTPTTQLFSRQEALAASTVPQSIDAFDLNGGGTAVEYTVPTNTRLILLSTNKACLFREGSVAASLNPVVDGDGSTWLNPGYDRKLRVYPGQLISFIDDGVNDARVAIERYTGTNASLPPD